jgi:hypothetical protein
MGGSESGTERNTTEDAISGLKRPLKFDGSSKKVDHTNIYVYIYIWNMQINESKRFAANILIGKVRERHRADHD